MLHGRSRRHERGAIFLLAVYFAALAMLLLSGIALQRTSTEMRAAQRSRDQEQQFFLGEAGIDDALKLLSAPMPQLLEGQHTLTLPSGRAVYWVTTNPASVTLSPDTGMISREIQILPTGCLGTAACASIAATSLASFIAASPQALESIVRVQQPIQGRAISSSQIALGALGFWNFSPDGVTINGRLHVASGQATSIGVYPGVTVTPSVYVNPPEPEADGGYLTLEGATYDTKPAAIFYDTADPAAVDVVTATSPITAFGQSFPAIPAPSSCESTPLIIPANKTVPVNDGDTVYGVHDLDSSTSRIIFCVPYVEIGSGTHITFTTPTVLYTTSTSAFYPGASFINYGVLSTTTSLQARPDRGLTVVTAKESGRTSMYLGYTDASAYNPDGLVVSGGIPFTNETTPLPIKTGFIISDFLYLDGVNATYSAENTTSQPVTVLSWRQYSGPTPTGCTPNWTCTVWSACAGSSQTRTCTDTNSCGGTAGKPAETRSCIAPPPPGTRIPPPGTPPSPGTLPPPPASTAPPTAPPG